MAGILRVDQANVDYIYAKTVGGKTYIPGHIIRVSQTIVSGGSTTSGSLTTLGSASYTPSYSTSKVYVTYNSQWAMSVVTNAWFGTALYRDSTVLIDYVMNLGWFNISSAQQSNILTYTYLDSPATTSSVTYNFKVSSAYGQTVSLSNQYFTFMEVAQ